MGTLTDLGADWNQIDIEELGYGAHINQTTFLKKYNVVFWNDEENQKFSEENLVNKCELEPSQSAIWSGRELLYKEYHRGYYKLFLQPKLRFANEVLKRTLRCLEEAKLKVSGKINIRIPTDERVDYEVIVLATYPIDDFYTHLDTIRREFSKKEQRALGGERRVIFTKQIDPMIYVRQGGGSIREVAERAGNLDEYFYGKNFWLIKE